MKKIIWAAFFVSAISTACGLGGGGGGGGGGGSNGNANTNARLDPALYLDGPSFADAGVLFEAQLVSPLMNQSEAQAGGNPVPWPSGGARNLTLVAGPAGLTVDRFSGALAWTPSEAQAGIQPLTVSFEQEGKPYQTELEIRVQAKRLEASSMISAASGGVVEVLDSASPIHGSRITIPPGAAGQDQTITLHRLVSPVILPDVAIGVELSPSQVFSSPVTLEFAYTNAWLDQIGVSDESHLAVYYRNPATNGWEILPGGSVNAAQNRYTVTTTHFSTFGLFVDDMSSLNPGLGGDAIGLWRTFIGGSDAPVPSDAAAALEMTENLFQPRGFVIVQGGGFTPDAKNALLIHGIYSKDTNFAALKTWAMARYDNVIFYNYPSGMPIRTNAEWLGLQLVLDKSLFRNGSCMDVFAHSMGGLVARAVVENPNNPGPRILTPIVNVSMLGTPHLGHGIQAPGWFRPPTHAGIRDMTPGSLFLATLNAPPGQGWAKYYVVAGNSGSGDDGAVATGSAFPAGIFTISGAFSATGQGHSDLHVNIATNGVGAFLANNVVPKTIRADQVHFLSKEFVVTHRPLTPTQYEVEYESVRASASFSFDAEFFIPPLTPVSIVWKPVDPQLSCYSLEMEKQHTYLDDSFPALNLFVQNFGSLVADLPENGSVMHLTPPPMEISFVKRDEDVSVCYPLNYFPSPGQQVPPPPMQLHLYVGSQDEDALLHLGPF